MPDDRERISNYLDGLQSPMVNGIYRLTEGNPGAITAVTEVIKASGLERTSEIIQMFRDLNIHGGLLWLCYKDVCNYDAYALLSRLESGKIAEQLAALHYSGYKVPEGKDGSKQE